MKALSVNKMLFLDDDVKIIKNNMYWSPRRGNISDRILYYVFNIKVSNKTLSVGLDFAVRIEHPL